MGEQPYPIAIAGAGGRDNVEGLLSFTDPDNQPVASLPTTHEVLANGDAATIADGGNASLEWGDYAAGFVLLDLSSPTAPVVVIAGVYAISLSVASDDAMTAGGVIVATLSVDVANPPQVAGTAAATTANLRPKVPLSLTAHLTPLTALVVNALNDDGAKSNDIYIEAASIQRIS